MSEIDQVRDKTTPDTTRLSDAKIQEYLSLYNDREAVARVLLAAADCCEYLDSFIEFNSISADGISLGKPNWSDKAKNYRSQATKGKKETIFLV